MFDDAESTITFFVAIFVALGVVLWLGIAVWAYRDIRERTRDGASQGLAVALVVLFNLPGLFLYLLLRPRETLIEAHERRLQNQALSYDLAAQPLACPSCQRPARDDFMVCPHCRAKLREPCASCERGLEPSWVACPYCGTQAPKAKASSSAAAAPAPPPLPAEERAPTAPQSTESSPKV